MNSPTAPALLLLLALAACGAEEPENQPNTGVATEALPNPQRDTEALPSTASAPPAGWFGSTPTPSGLPGTGLAPMGWGPP
jgi:hypothetical protein